MLGTSRSGQRAIIAVEGSQRFEGMITGAPIKKIGIAKALGNAGRSPVGLHLQGRHHPIRLGEGQRSQQDGVDQTENGSRRADAERQRQNRGKRKTWALA
jgi:hypothetical protein